MKLANVYRLRNLTYVVAAALAASVSLLSCKAQEPEATTSSAVLSATEPKPIYAGERLNGHKAIKLNDKRYLANSENLGLFLFDDQGKVISASKGNYEGLDVRTVNDKTYAISVNKELGQVELYNIEQTQLRLTNSIKLAKTRVNNVCLYQPNEHELQAILLTEDLRFEQRLVLDDLGQSSDFTLIRELSAPPHSSACAADDKQSFLYIAEETIGIWSYPLNPEQELQRQPIAMAQPYGELEGEIKDLSILPDGRVLAAMPDMQQLLLLQAEQGVWSSHAVKVSGDATPESASFAAGGQVIWFDKETDSYLSQTVTLPEHRVELDATKITSVIATGQTEPVKQFGDVADDPAIWPNKTRPSDSKILATDKSEGLYVYGLDGTTSQFIASGRVNNVDISFGFDWQGEQVDLAAASNRTFNSISLYAITQNGQVSEIGSVPTTLPDVYGLCSYKSNKDNAHYVFINDENGTFQQYRISAPQGEVTGELVREFAVPTQPEGCVADEKTATLYLGEEGKGVWQTSAEPEVDSELELVIKIDKKVLFDDVEGLSIYHGEATNYLVVSSQGNDSYVLYDLKDLSLAGTFKVTANYQDGIDGTSETDGLAVSSFNFGGDYADGLLVVQDGRNVMPTEPQNFKLISWQGIKQQLQLPD